MREKKSLCPSLSQRVYEKGYSLTKIYLCPSKPYHGVLKQQISNKFLKIMLRIIQKFVTKHLLTLIGLYKYDLETHFKCNAFLFVLQLLFFLIMAFIWFHYGWFTVFCQFSTVQLSILFSGLSICFSLSKSQTIFSYLFLDVQHLVQCLTLSVTSLSIFGIELNPRHLIINKVDQTCHKK